MTKGVVGKARPAPGLGRHCPRIVYVLSGGAAMGFCHLGMIEALEKRGVRPDLVDVLFQPVDRTCSWSSFAEYEKYLDACTASVRRLISATLLKRLTR